MQKTLKQEAEAYEPKKTLNVTDLDRLDLSLPVEDREGIDKKDKPFSYKAVVIGTNDFRIANTVLEEIQKMLKLKPEMKFVKVTSTGTGLATRYSVELAE